MKIGSFIFSFTSLLFLSSFPRVSSALIQVNQILLAGEEENRVECAVDSPCVLSHRLPNLREMRYLSFWMKGRPESGIALFVEVAANGTRDRAAVGPFSGEPDPDGWRKIVIPLSAFSGIRDWNGASEISLIIEGQGEIETGKIGIDRLLFGSNYPDGTKGQEIPMQNRVSSFKIGNRLTSPVMNLKTQTTAVTLTLTFVDPYLEEIRFEESKDGGKTWRRIESFYDHARGGIYSTIWNPPQGMGPKKEIVIRAIGISILGGEYHLAGPSRIRFD